MPNASTIENRLRRKAARAGYMLRKARSIRWEGDGFTPLYRLIDIYTALPAGGFDNLPEVEAWLTDNA